VCKVQWDIVSLDRNKGRLGLSKVWEFNIALLGELWWRLRVDHGVVVQSFIPSISCKERWLVVDKGNKASIW